MKVRDVAAGVIVDLGTNPIYFVLVLCTERSFISGGLPVDVRSLMWGNKRTTNHL